MFKTIKKLNFILNKSHKKKILFLLFLLILTVFFDMVGLSLLYPVLSVMNDSNIEGVFNLGVIFKYLPQNINQGLNI